MLVSRPAELGLLDALLDGARTGDGGARGGGGGAGVGETTQLDARAARGEGEAGGLGARGRANKPPTAAPHG